MPDVATGMDAIGLEQQVMQESAAAISEHAAAIAGKSEAETPPENEGVETPPATETPADETVEEPEVAPEVEAPKDPPADDTGSTIKLGLQEFATPEDATKEYNRVVGRNAHLAGEKKAVETQLTAAQEEIAALREANKQWAEYHQATENGEEAEMPTSAKPTQGMTEEQIAKITEDTITRRETLAAHHAQIDKLEGLSNYPQVVDTIVSLAEKLNPFTGVFYTPEEAYVAACGHLGLPNLLVETPVAKPATAPRVVANPDAVKAAGRPAPAGAGGAAPKNDAPDPWDDHIDKQFQRLNLI